MKFSRNIAPVIWETKGFTLKTAHTRSDGAEAAKLTPQGAINMYQNNGTKAHRRDCKTLRLQGVKNHPDLVIDQYGRVFKNGSKFEFVGCGYATH